MEPPVFAGGFLRAGFVEDQREVCYTQSRDAHRIVLREMRSSMIKVVVADDEERVCQLIVALVDWKAMGLEVAGIAHNGLEAFEMVERLRPDILITDIRMPGYSGLELIQRVQSVAADLEIIVISGYAHFEYAQQAIKYGVGDYLLKPVSKADLTATLEKLKERICQRRDSEQDRQEMRRKAEKDVHRLQLNLLDDLWEKENLALSMPVLQDTYHLQVQPGLFQAFLLKIDSSQGTLSDASAAILMEKAQEILERGLKEKCFELALGTKGPSCIGIINYDTGRQEEIRKVLKNCLNQLELQKSLFRPVLFSMAVGSAYTDPQGLDKSMKETAVLIQERIVKGTGRVLERLGAPSGLDAGGILDRYLREITQAVEVMSLAQAEAAVNFLMNEVRRVKDVHGYEILELVSSAADVFSVRTQMPERGKQLEAFRKQCGQCTGVEEVFACLARFQEEYISGLLVKHESETIRPVRRAKEYIQNHYSEPLTLEEVSSIAGLSPAYFSVLFKKTEGEGFAKYLINIRMEKAKILLRESNTPVSEICRMVGYNDIKHFNHTFEKAAGVKPATYRRLYG